MKKIILPLLLLLLSGCAAEKKENIRPDWINNPGSGVASSAMTHVRGRYHQEQLALTRAKEQLAARFGVEISSVHTVEDVVKNDQRYVESDKRIIQNLEPTTVKAQLRAKWHNYDTDELWVWVYPTGVQ